MARTDASLLAALQGIIERTYDLQTGISDIGRYVIGDEGYRRIYGPLAAGGGVVEKVGAGYVASGEPGARTLVRDDGAGTLALSIYYPDHLIECLESNDPTRRLDDGNVDAFAAFVEELDHLLVIADRHRSNGVISLLDLELHANVTKYLTLRLFVGKLRRARRLSTTDVAWIRFHLFEKGEFVQADPEVRARYQDATRLASLYVRRLDMMAPSLRPGALRRFHRMTPQEKIGHIGAMN